MRLGYACINTSIKTKVRTCRLATYRKEGNSKIKELTIVNTHTILETLKWNVANGIYFFRVTSNLIPLGTHEEFDWDWENDEEVMTLFNEIKKFRELNNIRISCHPGQYTVLNSPNEQTFQNAVADLEMHDKIMNYFGGTDMIIHTGGAYGDKDASKIRFAEKYKTLSDSIKRKLRLENDDKTFNVQDVLDIHNMCGVPIVLDIHHNNCNPSELHISELIDDVMKSWEGYGIPKTHISTGRTSFTDIAHHDYVSEEDFKTFLSILGNYDVDIMFESKSKEMSVLSLRDKGVC